MKFMYVKDSPRVQKILKLTNEREIITWKIFENIIQILHHSLFTITSN